MRRACKLTVKFLTKTKLRKVAALLEAYRAGVNFYIKSLWEIPGRLDKLTLERLKGTRLSVRYKSQALKQALDIVTGTIKSAKAIKKQVSCPKFTSAAILDAKFVTIEDGKGEFDIMIKLSTLKKGKRIWLPTRATKILRKWLNKQGATLIQGCALSEDAIILWVNIPDATFKVGSILGVDIGINKLISDSNGSHYGTKFKEIRDKIVRRQPGSKSRRRAFTERDNLINLAVKQLPWSSLEAIGVEDLRNLKRGKKKNRNKSFRKAISPWVYRQVITRIKQVAQQNRVRVVSVDPRNTSRTCPICNTVNKRSRRGEEFQCVACNYKQDSDTVGALNILARTLSTLRSVGSLGPQKVMK